MDIKKLLLSLNDHKVCFVLIGAAAFPAHGYDRSTQDIDIFIKPTLANAKRTYRALESVGYDLQGLPEDHLLKKKVLLRQYILDTDIHPFVKGVSFAEVWKNKVKSAWQGIPIFIASLPDLIKMKIAANRPKDLEDLRILRKILALQSAKTKT